MIKYLVSARLLLVVLFVSLGTFVIAPIDHLEATASSHQLRGGEDCFYTPAFACPTAPASTCSTTACKWFGFGFGYWYCEDGTYEYSQDATSHLKCRTRPLQQGDYSNCDSSGQSGQAVVCVSKRSCGDGCITAGVGGGHWCEGPVGNSFCHQCFWVPVLYGNVCEEEI